MVIQKPEEQNRIHELQERVNELEKALAQTTLDKLMLTATLEVIEREYGTKLKKTTAQPSSKRRTSKQRGLR
jgi:hypothetical protein